MFWTMSLGNVSLRVPLKKMGKGKYQGKKGGEKAGVYYIMHTDLPVPVLVNYKPVMSV